MTHSVYLVKIIFAIDEVRSDDGRMGEVFLFVCVGDGCILCF